MIELIVGGGLGPVSGAVRLDGCAFRSTLNLVAWRIWRGEVDAVVQACEADGWLVSMAGHARGCSSRSWRALSGPERRNC